MYFVTSICFICLKSENDLNVINTDMLTKLLYCLDKTEDFIPSTFKEREMCTDCLNKLNTVFDFKKMCLKNIVQFKEYVDQLEQSYNFNSRTVMAVGLTDDKLKDTSKINESANATSAQYSDEQLGTGVISEKNLNGIYFENNESKDTDEKGFVKELKLSSPYQEVLGICKVELKDSTEIPKVNLIDVKHQDEPSHHYEQHSDEQIFVKNEIAEIYLETRGNNESQIQSFHKEHKLILNKEEILADVNEKELENQPRKLMEHDYHQYKKPNEMGSNKKSLENIICLICEETFPNKRNLLRHMNIHNKKHCCPKCQKCLSNTRSLRMHMLIHTENKPYQCSICGNSYGHIKNLARHKLIHSNERPYSCSVCKKSFITQAPLDNHMIIHTNERPYLCSICMKGFTRKECLKKHTLTHSTPQFSCTICMKNFIQKSVLDRHMLIHSGGAPYSCSVCEKSFIKKYNLDKHVLTHSNKRPYSCSICKKDFSLNSSLDRHMISKHSYGKPFACSICEKSFKHKKYLNTHMSYHNNEPRFYCSVCSKGFFNKFRLKSHVTIHSNERPYSCSECMKGFKQKRYLNKHVLRCHS